MYFNINLRFLYVFEKFIEKLLYHKKITQMTIKCKLFWLIPKIETTHIQMHYQKEFQIVMEIMNNDQF